MAGLGEACTHIGAVLFYLEAVTNSSNNVTCTQQRCKWVVPTQREIPYLPIKGIDFTSAKTKHNAEALDQVQVSVPCSSNIGPPDQSEVVSFFENLSKCGSKPAILSLVHPYSDNYVPKAVQPSFPRPLPELYDVKYLKYSYTELLAACEETEIIVTEQMAVAVETETRAQSKSNLWFTYRAGRVTASRMKSVCHTDPAYPSQALIKGIVYPEVHRFTSTATTWGFKHEKHARDYYCKLMVGSHSAFEVNEAGLSLSTKWPFLGASPDGVVNCHCCGKGVLEIKCPFCHRNDSILESSHDRKFCLHNNSQNSLVLDPTHSYYYQVQTQIFVCGVEYCDFVVCTFPEDQQQPDIHIERVYPNERLWSECVEKSSHFFKFCILPEVLGRWYSRPYSQQSSSSSPPTSSTPADQLFCYCRQPEDNERSWIGCDNPGCSIEWYHTECLKLKSVPKGKWYCPTCRVLPEFKRRTKKQKCT